MARPDPAYRPITADEFLSIDFGPDRKFELVNRVIHAHVAGNIYFALRQKLRGSACRPFNSDLGLRVDETNIRYLDVAVYRGKTLDLPEQDVLAFDDPYVVFELLSPSTSRIDQGRKSDEYRRMSSLPTIVFVDPINRFTRLFSRLPDHEDGWQDTGFGAPHDISIPALGITLTEAEIFARD